MQLLQEHYFKVNKLTDFFDNRRNSFTLSYIPDLFTVSYAKNFRHKKAFFHAMIDDFSVNKAAYC
jgi:hypothetical protein